MFKAERYEEILDFLRQKKYATVKAIAAYIHTSEATVRRDIAFLESQGDVKHTYGGVVISTYHNTVVPVSLRESANSAKKEEIALSASELIHDNDVVIFDSSSTVRRMCKHILKRNNLKVITNNLRVCDELKDTDINVICAGGALIQHRDCFMGGFTNDFFRNLNVDSVFFSMQGLDENGNISDSSDEEVALRKIMLSCAKNKYFLCDSSKIGIKKSFILCNTKDITKVICDVP